jgi:hypothetical protein
LRAKGYAPADRERADFLLNYRVGSTPTSAAGGTRSVGRGGWWVGWAGWEGRYTEDFDQGALFIAALDPKIQHMIWLGVAEARLLPHISYDRSLGRIDDAVEHQRVEVHVQVHGTAEALDGRHGAGASVGDPPPLRPPAVPAEARARRRRGRLES